MFYALCIGGERDHCIVLKKEVSRNPGPGTISVASVPFNVLKGRQEEERTKITTPWTPCHESLAAKSPSLYYHPVPWKCLKAV